MHIEKSRQRPGSIRNRILLFSILVTLVPSFGMGWFWYDISSKTTTSKVEQRLVASADIVEREIDLWFKERNYDLRVFSNSFVVAENLAIYQQDSQNETTDSQQTETALKKITTYLGLINTKFSDYHRLSIRNSDGNVVASSRAETNSEPATLPANWQQQVDRRQYFVGDTFIADETGAPLVLIGIPLLSNEQDRPIAFFTIEAYLKSIESLFYSSLSLSMGPTSNRGMNLLLYNGRVLFSTASPEKQYESLFASSETMDLFARPKILQTYMNGSKVEMLGIALPLDNLPWLLLVEENKAAVYGSLKEARNKILLIVGLMTIAIGGTAVIVARQIIGPLQLLTAGVLQVANGDVDVNIPVCRNDELGIVTEMFNNMVHRLGESKARLEELATTDPLTGLANRKQIMASLDQQLEGYCRYGTDFSVLMLDIDYFKKVNDTYGHQAGDLVLSELAAILRHLLRTLDTAGRYGGEEFIVILDTTDIDKAAQTAERIRQAVENVSFSWQDQQLQVTVSIGVSAITTDDSTVTSLISRVDQALYKAKAEGRNRVCLLHSDTPQVMS